MTTGVDQKLIDHFVALHVFYGLMDPGGRCWYLRSNWEWLDPDQARKIKLKTDRLTEYVNYVTSLSPYIAQECESEEQLVDEMLQAFADCVYFRKIQHRFANHWGENVYSITTSISVTMTEAFQARQIILEFLLDTANSTDEQIRNGQLRFPIDEHDYQSISLVDSTFGPESDTIDYVRPVFSAQKAHGSDVQFNLSCKNEVVNHEKFGELLQFVAAHPSVKKVSITLPHSTTPAALTHLAGHVSVSFGEKQLDELSFGCWYEHSDGFLDGTIAQRIMAKIAKIATKKLEIGIKMSECVLYDFLRGIADSQKPLDSFTTKWDVFDTAGKWETLASAWTSTGSELVTKKLSLSIYGDVDALSPLFPAMMRSLTRVVAGRKIEKLSLNSDDEDDLFGTVHLTEENKSYAKNFLDVIHGGGISSFKLSILTNAADDPESTTRPATFLRLLVDSFPAQSQLKKLSFSTVFETHHGYWDRLCPVLEKMQVLEDLSIDHPPDEACERKLAGALKENTSLLTVKIHGKYVDGEEEDPSEFLLQTAEDCTKRNLRNKLIRCVKKCSESPALVGAAATSLVSTYDEDVAQAALFTLVSTVYLDILMSLEGKDGVTGVLSQE